MRFLFFLKEIFAKFPFFVINNTLLLLFVGLLDALSILTVAPVVDFAIHSDRNNLSLLTVKIGGILNGMGIPVTLISLCTIFFLINVFRSLFVIVSRYLMMKTKFRVLEDMMMGTYKVFLDARWYFFTSNNQGTLINTFSRESVAVSEGFFAVTSFAANLIQIMFFFAVPFYFSWKVTSVSLISAVLFACPFLFLGKINYRLGTICRDNANQMSRVIQESLNSAKVILGFGNQKKSFLMLSKAFDTYTSAALKTHTAEAAIPILYYPLGMLVLLITLLSSQWFSVPLSETVAVLFSLMRIVPLVGTLTGQKNSFEALLPSYEQVMNLRNQAAQLKQRSGHKIFNGFEKEILIDNVSYAYPGDKLVLSDINMRISKGRMIALVGESGAGKSTLIDMVMGFNEPVSGAITFDGVHIEEYDIVSLRQRIGYVPQESILFDASIRDNLLWANDSADESDIHNACSLANAEEFIQELSDGYETVVGDRGVRLSGGQIQRIALARAILRKPELLILDEATSSLDSKSERLIQQSIEAIAKRTTVIVIAHRLSTVMNADYIYVLKNGRILEEGTYSDLLGQDGMFNDMVQLQKLT